MIIFDKKDFLIVLLLLFIKLIILLINRNSFKEKEMKGLMCNKCS